MKYVGRREALFAVVLSWVKPMLLESVASTVDISCREIDRLRCIESVPHRKS
jgi:hypothetical protein